MDSRCATCRWWEGDPDLVNIVREDQAPDVCKRIAEDNDAASPAYLSLAFVSLEFIETGDGPVALASEVDFDGEPFRPVELHRSFPFCQTGDLASCPQGRW